MASWLPIFDFPPRGQILEAKKNEIVSWSIDWLIYDYYKWLINVNDC